MKEVFTEQLFISSQVLKAVNITYRQLSYWELKGIIKPILQKQGTRDFKRYTQSNIDTLKRIKNLIDEGYSLPTTNTLNEIAKRREAEKALRESREKYRALAESSVDAIFIHDCDGQYLYANQACTKLFGRKPDEIVGKNLTDFFTEEKVKEVLDGIRRVFFENNIVHIEYSFLLEGTNRYFFATLAPIHSIQGDVVSVMRVARDITERKKAEVALRVSEQKFKDLTETTTDWVWEVDKDGVYTYASPKVKELLGYEVNEVLGRTPFDLMPAEESEKIRKFFKEKVIKKEPFDRLENINRHKDGHLIALETSGIPLFDEKGQLKGYRGIDRDITQRKKTEEELIAAKDYIENIIKSMTDILIVVDPDGKIKTVNKATSLLLGYKNDELIGNDVSLILTEEEEEEEEETPFKGTKLEKLIEEGQLRNYEINYKSKDDRKIPVLLSGAVLKAIDCPHKGPIKDCLVYKKKGKHCEKIQGVVCVAKDITEHRKTEKALQEAKAFSDNLIASMKDGFSVLDNHGVHINVNPALCQMTGFSREELIGVGPPHPYWPPEEYEKIEQAFQKTLRGEFDDFELVFMRKNGERFSVIISPSWIKDKQGNIISYFATVKNITKRKQAAKIRKSV